MTIQISSQRGWREPVAQVAVLRLALDADDKAEAAHRYAALFLQRGAAVMPPAAFSAVTRATVDRGAKFDCTLLEQAVKTLERRDAAAAQSLAAAKACG